MRRAAHLRPVYSLLRVLAIRPLPQFKESEMERVTCKSLLDIAYRAEMTVQPIEKGRYQLRHIPSLSGAVFVGTPRECAIFLKGFYLGDNKQPMTAKGEGVCSGQGQH